MQSRSEGGTGHERADQWHALRTHDREDESFSTARSQTPAPAQPSTDNVEAQPAQSAAQLSTEPSTGSDFPGSGSLPQVSHSPIPAGGDKAGQEAGKLPHPSGSGSGQIKALFQDADAALAAPAQTPAATTAPPAIDWLSSQDRFMSLANGIMQAAPGSTTPLSTVGEYELATEQTEAAWHQLPATSGMHTASWPLHRGKEASSQELPRTVSADPAVKGAGALGEGMPPLHGLQLQALSASALFPNEMSGALSLEGMDRNRITELALAQLSAGGSLGPLGSGRLSSHDAAHPMSSVSGPLHLPLQHQPPTWSGHFGMDTQQLAEILASQNLDEEELAAASYALQDPSVEPAGPSKHLWLGNLHPRLTRTALRAAFESFGELEDVVTFPGRMYAFVNFCAIQDAIRAVQLMHGRTVAHLSGDRPLMIKFRSSKRALGRLGDELPEHSSLSPRSPAMSTPRRHSYDEEHVHSAATTPRADLLENASTRIWCGNIASHVTSRTLKTIFASHGYYLTDVAVFPARIGPLGYAFINFPTLDQAVDAFTKLQNTVIPAITASKQLKMRFKPIQTGAFAFQEKDAAVRVADTGDAALMPTANLSNKLNPNNIHYDRDAAVQYKGLSKADKEALWAHDRGRYNPLSGGFQPLGMPPPGYGAAEHLLAHHASLERPLGSTGIPDSVLAGLPGMPGGFEPLGSLSRQPDLSMSQRAALLQAYGEPSAEALLAGHSQGSLRLPSAPLMSNLPMAPQQPQPLGSHPVYPQLRSADMYDAALLRAGAHAHPSLPARMGSLGLEDPLLGRQQQALAQQLLQQQALGQPGPALGGYGGLDQLGSGDLRGLHLSPRSGPFPPPGASSAWPPDRNFTH